MIVIKWPKVEEQMREPTSMPPHAGGQVYPEPVNPEAEIHTACNRLSALALEMAEVWRTLALLLARRS